MLQIVHKSPIDDASYVNLRIMSKRHLSLSICNIYDISSHIVTHMYTSLVLKQPITKVLGISPFQDTAPLVGECGWSNGCWGSPHLRYNYHDITWYIISESRVVINTVCSHLVMVQKPGTLVNTIFFCWWMVGNPPSHMGGSMEVLE